MNEKERTYIAIDLKSFYASVECVERGLDPLTTNLVVADRSRTDKTICLAVSPSLKAYGISGRARLFEVVQRVRELNAQKKNIHGSSWLDEELKRDPSLAIDYIVAPPRMAHYMNYSTRVYNVYLRYVSEEDMHVYSIDEVFIDATSYLTLYGLTPRELAMKIVKDVLAETGITATAGIGTNMYLAKIAMDIVAKHVPADSDGVRVAELNERSYRETLWTHEPLTDFWRVGQGISKKLMSHGIRTMGDIARCSLGGPADIHSEDLLYRLFGVNAELLIDHAWGYEPCTIKDIKSARPSSRSISHGQVLSFPYPYKDARLIIKEMADALALDLVSKRIVTDQIVITIGYDQENVRSSGGSAFSGETEEDRYGRTIPKNSHGSANLDRYTSASSVIVKASCSLFDDIADRRYSIRRINIAANHVVSERDAKNSSAEQLSLFTDYESSEKEKEALKDENRLQRAILDIKEKHGKNAIIKGMNLEEGATARSRNEQIGGHKA